MTKGELAKLEYQQKLAKESVLALSVKYCLDESPTNRRKLEGSVVNCLSIMEAITECPANEFTNVTRHLSQERKAA